MAFSLPVIFFTGKPLVNLRCARLAASAAAQARMTGALPHPDGEGNQCLHCDAEMSSVWRPDNAGSGYVCRCNDCWRLEGWLPPKKKRGRKSKSNTG